jgi:hypothetical protein
MLGIALNYTPCSRIGMQPAGPCHAVQVQSMYVQAGNSKWIAPTHVAGSGGLSTTGGGGVNIATSTPLSISNPIKIKAPTFEKGGGLLAGVAIAPANNGKHGGGLIGGALNLLDQSMNSLFGRR